MSKERRKDIRVNIISEAISVETTEWKRTLEYTDIGKHGVFIKSTELPKSESVVLLKFQLPGQLGDLTVTGRVIRINWTVDKKRNKPHLGFAVEFLDMSDSSRRILDAFIVYMRNKQIINVSKRIIEEFFGSQRR